MVTGTYLILSVLDNSRLTLEVNSGGWGDVWHWIVSSFVKNWVCLGNNAFETAFVRSKHYDCHWNHSHVVVRYEFDGANTIVHCVTKRLSELVMHKGDCRFGTLVNNKAIVRTCLGQERLSSC